jgi:hypothetical protein
MEDGNPLLNPDPKLVGIAAPTIFASPIAFTATGTGAADIVKFVAMLVVLVIAETDGAEICGWSGVAACCVA